MYIRLRHLLGVVLAACMLTPATAQINLLQNSASNYTLYYPVQPPLPGTCLQASPLGAGYPLQWGCAQSIQVNRSLFQNSDAWGRANVAATITAGNTYAPVDGTLGLAVNQLGLGGAAVATIGKSVTNLNPNFTGGRAQNAEATAGANGNLVGAAYDLVGKQIISPYANKENFVEGTTSVTGTSSTSLIGTPGAGLFIYVTHFSCFNSGSTGTTVSLQNGSGGTTIWEGYVAATGGGFVATFPAPIGGVNNMTANTALYFAAGSSTTTLYCNASGYKGT